eukprot:5831602-Pyramimonas_sp.AAC.1
MSRCRGALHPASGRPLGASGLVPGAPILGSGVGRQSTRPRSSTGSRRLSHLRGAARSILAIPWERPSPAGMTSGGSPSTPRPRAPAASGSA